MTAGRWDRLALPFWFTTFLLLSADLSTKSLVRKALAPGDPPVNVIGEWFRIYHVRNTGGLFGILPGNAVYFAVVSVVAVAVILYLVYRSHYRGWKARTSLGLILGGALGNFHDRIRYESVVDFLDVGGAGFRWPTFNIADAGVLIGVAWLAWILFREDPLLYEPEPGGSDDGDPVRRTSGAVDGWS